MMSTTIRSSLFISGNGGLCPSLPPPTHESHLVFHAAQPVSAVSPLPGLGGSFRGFSGRHAHQSKPHPWRVRAGVANGCSRPLRRPSLSDELSEGRASVRTRHAASFSEHVAHDVRSAVDAAGGAPSYAPSLAMKGLPAAACSCQRDALSCLLV